MLALLNHKELVLPSNNPAAAASGGAAEHLDSLDPLESPSSKPDEPRGVVFLQPGSDFSRGVNFQYSVAQISIQLLLQCFVAVGGSGLALLLSYWGARACLLVSAFFVVTWKFPVGSLRLDFSLHTLLSSIL